MHAHANLNIMFAFLSFIMTDTDKLISHKCVQWILKSFK